MSITFKLPERVLIENQFLYTYFMETKSGYIQRKCEDIVCDVIIKGLYLRSFIFGHIHTD